MLNRWLESVNDSPGLDKLCTAWRRQWGQYGDYPIKPFVVTYLLLATVYFYMTNCANDLSVLFVRVFVMNLSWFKLLFFVGYFFLILFIVFASKCFANDVQPYSVTCNWSSCLLNYWRMMTWHWNCCVYGIIGETNLFYKVWYLPTTIRLVNYVWCLP